VGGGHLDAISVGGHTVLLGHSGSHLVNQITRVGRHVLRSKEHVVVANGDRVLVGHSDVGLGHHWHSAAHDLGVAHRVDSHLHVSHSVLHGLDLNLLLQHLDLLGQPQNVVLLRPWLSERREVRVLHRKATMHLARLSRESVLPLKHGVVEAISACGMEHVLKILVSSAGSELTWQIRSGAWKASGTSHGLI